MSAEKNTAETYKQLQAMLDEMLKRRGYVLTHYEYAEKAFGSRFSVWINSSDTHRYRLIYDGRDAWFILEESPCLNDQKMMAWTNIVNVPFDVHDDRPDYRAEIIASMSKEIK